MHGAAAAARLGHSYVGVEHVLLELLDGRPDAAAQAVLLGVGVAPIDVERHLGTADGASGGLSPNPRWYGLVGRAKGLALGLGDGIVRSTDLLLALLWDEGQLAVLDLPGGVTRDAVAAALLADGVTVPSAPLPTPTTWSDRWTQATFPVDQLNAALAAMHERHPRGQHWGWNVDGAGLAWVDAEDGVDLAAVFADLGLQVEIEQHPATG